MKLQELKIPYGIHCVFPAAILATCLVILAVVRLHPGCTQLLPLVASSEETDDGWRTDSGNQSSCDIFKGEWVPDPGARKPYTPETCPVIHGHYDCMRYGRPDPALVPVAPRRLFLLPRFLAASGGQGPWRFVGDSPEEPRCLAGLPSLLRRSNQRRVARRNASSHRVSLQSPTTSTPSSLSGPPVLVRAVGGGEPPNGPARSAAGQLWRLHLDKPRTRA
ncbi:hypothetical protein PR202_gb29266 [Eleusine coracana subsp. coracana]|uniref:Trichome birefringence-like N-terminal domain-containing protein n=1 Tax=Eleusine coracana subsp. coracana TaxID=191504 RepID=A0AAV5FYZ8_ELECO|nr:hypothetical protein PR202_gb29266 [Eleusine coracana subsp. coracana]